MTSQDEALEEEKAILQLRTVAYELSIFHEELLKDREGLNEKMDQISKLVFSFDETVDEFKQLESKVRSNLALAIAKATEKAQEGIGERLGQVAAEQMNSTTQKLKQASESAVQTLKHYQSDRQWTSWRTYLGALLVSIAVGIGSSFWLVKPASISEGQAITLNYGEVFKRVWPQLTADQKHQMAELYIGQTGDPQDVDRLINDFNKISKLTNIEQ